MIKDMSFQWANLWIPAILLLPNLAYLIWKPRGPRPIIGGLYITILTVLERLGQAGSFVLPLFFPFELSGDAGIVVSFVMAMTMVVYYSGWVRYFGNGREYRLLFERVFSMPIPMAICPVVFLACLALLERSLLVSVFVVLLAAGHLPLSLLEKRLYEEDAADRQA